MQGNGLRDRAREFAAAGCVIVGVSFDAVAKNHAFARKLDLPFALACDEAKQVGAAYDAIEPDGEDAGWPRRVSFLIDPGGVVARVYDPVDPTTHAATVLRDLEGAAD